MCPSHHWGAAMTQPFHSSGCFPVPARVWVDNGVSVRSAVPSPTPQASERQRGGQTQTGATSTPLAAFPLRGWLGDCRQGAIVLTGTTRSPAHATWQSCQLLSPSYTSWIPPQVVPSHDPVPEHVPHLKQHCPNSNTSLNLWKEPNTKSKTVPC